jgi:hypothetical protein
MNVRGTLVVVLDSQMAVMGATVIPVVAAAIIPVHLTIRSS